MSLLITDSKICKPARQLCEAQNGNAIYLTLKNLKKERSKHLKEIALAKHRQSSPIGQCNHSNVLSKRWEDHSDRKLQEIENNWRSKKNQGGEYSMSQSVFTPNDPANKITDEGKNQAKILDHAQNQLQEISQVKKDKENSNHTAKNRLSQNNLDNQRNSSKGSQETLNKQKRVNSAKGFVNGTQESEHQQMSNVFLSKGYNNRQDSLSAMKKKQNNQSSINLVDKCVSYHQQKLPIEMKRQDIRSSSASGHRISENSVSELRLKRIREQNASKSRIVLSQQSSNEQAALQGHDQIQSKPYLGNLIEDPSGSLKEGAKKRIKDLITSEESQPNEYLNVEPDEIKGYINGLIQVLHNIGSSSKQTIKQGETANKLENNNQKICKSLGTHQEYKINGSIKKQSEYNPIKYGYSQGMSSEILHSVIIKKKESSADHVESRSHRSISPHHENMIHQTKVSLENDESPKKQRSLSVASKLVKDINCNINTKQQSNQVSVVTKSLGKKIELDKPSGSREQITGKNIQKEMEAENDRSLQQKQQQQMANINKCSWFGSIENRDSPQSSQILHKPILSVQKEHKKELQKQQNNQEEQQIILKRHSKQILNSQNPDKLDDCVELVDIKNQRREGLIKVHSGRNIIKTMNPYRSAVSLESLRRPRGISASNSIQKQSYSQNEGAVETQQQNNTKKSRSKTHYQSQNAETIHTTQSDKNNKENEKPAIRDEKSKTSKENERKSCFLLEDENYNEVRNIKQSISQVGFSQLRNSIVNSELLNDVNIKGSSHNEEAGKVSLKQQMSNITQSSQGCSSNNNNRISKQSEMKNNLTQNDQHQNLSNKIKVQNLESANRNNAKKPPTHKQLLQNKNYYAQPDQFCMQLHQQQPQAAQNIVLISKPTSNSFSKLSRQQSSHTKITQGIHSNNEVSPAAMQQSNNQQDKNSNPQSNYDNDNNNTCERILDLLLLNTHELKNKFQEAEQQKQQISAKKSRSKSTLGSQPHISPSINDFKQFASKLFSQDYNLP